LQTDCDFVVFDDYNGLTSAIIRIEELAMIAVVRRPRRIREFVLLLVISGLTGHVQPARAATADIDAEHSTLTIRVYKTGLFAAFAHDHEINAPIRQGSFDEDKQAVELSVDARTLRVVDPGVSASERSQIQATMLGPKVLDSDKFQEIKFRSTSVERAGEGKWTVHGELTLHGQTHPVKLEVQGGKGHYRGSAVLKQKDFGITPVSIAGGSVKVKDEIRVEFDIEGKHANASDREFGAPHLTCIQRFA
jgi:polyisoprenoid-binding protein YceI